MRLLFFGEWRCFAIVFPFFADGLSFVTFSFVFPLFFICMNGAASSGETYLNKGTFFSNEDLFGPFPGVMNATEELNFSGLDSTISGRLRSLPLTPKEL